MNSIKILDNNLNVIEEISNIPPRIVDLIGISDSLFNNTKEICNAFWYAKVKGEKINAIVNGRQVFKIQNSNQDTKNRKTVDEFVSKFTIIPIFNSLDISVSGRESRHTRTY